MTNKENVEKNTLNDRVQLMHTAVREQLDDKYYYKDSTEEFIYVSDWQDSCHYQFSYSMDGIPWSWTKTVCRKLLKYKTQLMLRLKGL